MELLAGLSVTTKAVERTAEAIGEDIEVGHSASSASPATWSVPIPLGPRIPILICGDGWHRHPVVRKESEGRAGKQDGQPAHTREASWAAYSRRPPSIEEGYPLGMKPRPDIVGAIESCEEFGRRRMPKPGSGAGRGAEKK